MPRGLTYNWNVAYKLFKSSPQYDAVFFINNDILFPNDTFTRLAQVGHGGAWHVASTLVPCEGMEEGLMCDLLEA